MSLLLVATSSAPEGSKGGNSDLDPPASPAATPAHNSLIETERRQRSNSRSGTGIPQGGSALRAVILGRPCTMPTVN
jgi:hypothetical protein